MCESLYEASQGRATFDIPKNDTPKNIIILIYFDNFKLELDRSSGPDRARRLASVEEGWAWNDELPHIPKKKR